MTASATGHTRWAAAKDERGRSFGAVAADYAAWRPSYLPAVVAFLVGARGRRRILDLGAGTGQLREPLVAAGHDVVAVDTSADMLAQLAVRLPDVSTRVAGAEDLPLPDGDVDVVVGRPGGALVRPPPGVGGVPAGAAAIRALLVRHADTRGRDLLDVTYRTSSWRLVPR